MLPKSYNLSLLGFFNTPSACSGVTDKKSGPGLALGFNTLYFFVNIFLIFFKLIFDEFIKSLFC